MKIEITQEELSDLIELLNAMSEIRYNQAAALAGISEAADRFQECLQQARTATRLFMKLAKY